MENVRLVKILILVVVLFAVLGFFGYYFFRTEDVPILQTRDIAGASEQGREVVQALSQLKNLKIDSGVFDVPGFDTYIDFSININSEDIQRPNPYAPIGIETRVQNKVDNKKIPQE